MNAKRYFVSGEVQGVGYRFFTVRVAQRLGISGFVRNLGDGRVEVYAIGDPDQQEDLRAALAQGPRSARVASVIDQDAEVVERYSDSFAIEEE
ncbi:MAG TPA: acylphosphatase [Candidatus Acidoferrales bacterium]|nr:acylphosphatase [Candidatus Acidoferrales bacterium]